LRASEDLPPLQKILGKIRLQPFDIFSISPDQDVYSSNVDQISWIVKGEIQHSGFGGAPTGLFPFSLKCAEVQQGLRGTGASEVAVSEDNQE